MLVFPCVWILNGAVCLAVSCLMHTCTASHRSCGLSVAAIWNHVGKSVLWPLCFYFKQLFWFSTSAFFIFLLPSPPHFFPLFNSRVWRVPRCLCVGAHGWVALHGVASLGSILLGLADHSGGPWTSRTPTIPKLDAVVKRDVWSGWLLKDSIRGKQFTWLFHCALIIKHQKVMILGKKFLFFLPTYNAISPSLIVAIT